MGEDSVRGVKNEAGLRKGAGERLNVIASCAVSAGVAFKVLLIFYAYSR